MTHLPTSGAVAPSETGILPRLVLRPPPTHRTGTARNGRGAKSGKPRALIVGAGSVGQTLARHLQREGRFEIVGFVDDGAEPTPAPWPLLGRRAQTEDLVDEYAVDEVFLAYAPTWQQALVERLTACYPEVGVRVVPSSYEAMLCSSRVESRGDIALVRIAGPERRPADGLKRLCDILTSVTVLLLCAPLMLAVAIAIRLTSPGPVFFVQERVGRSGRPFPLYKFRTMRHRAEESTGPTLSVGLRDTRLTGAGRWLRACRIDEIPQLWNVLRGEMSMVGPRPERACFTQKFERATPTYARRHQVRPGITGLAQVCGGYHTDARDKLRFDLLYITHRSPWLDLSIMARTVLVVFLPGLHRLEREV